MSVNDLEYYSGYEFNLSANPLLKYQNSNKEKPSKQWTFLTSNSLKGFGTEKSQYQNDIRNNHLDKPLRQIHYVLQHTKNLRESDIYKIFNAQTLEIFFRNLLRNTKHNVPLENMIRPSVDYKYDFRTAEIARTMIDIGLDYLTKSPELKDNEGFQESKYEIQSYLNTFSISKFQQDISKNEFIGIPEDTKNELIKECLKIQSEIINLYKKIEIPLGNSERSSRKDSDRIVTFLKDWLFDLKLLELELERKIKCKENIKNIQKIKNEIKKQKKYIEKAEKDLETLGKINNKEEKLSEIESMLMGTMKGFISLFRPIRFNENHEIASQISNYQEKIPQSYFCSSCGGVARRIEDNMYKCEDCGIDIEMLFEQN